MQVTETTLLELRNGKAVLSTENLYRIIELPSGKVVGELADLDDAAFESSSDLDIETGESPFRVGVDYRLLEILESSGHNLMDIVVRPIAVSECFGCGSPAVSGTKRTRLFACGTKGRQDAKKSSSWEFPPFWPVEYTKECRNAEAALIRAIGEKSSLLKRLLIEAGETLIGPDYWWLVDSRDAGDQFQGLAEFEKSRVIPQLSAGVAVSMQAAMLA